MAQIDAPFREYSPSPSHGKQAFPSGEKVPALQRTVPSLASFGTYPGRADAQAEAPGREYSPLSLHGKQPFPSLLLYPPAQGFVSVRSVVGINPGKATIQKALPAKSEYSPGWLQPEQLAAPNGANVELGHGTQTLLTGTNPGLQPSQLVAAKGETSLSPQSIQRSLPPRLLS